MAIVNPDPQPVQDQNFLRYSRGEKEDTTWSTLFGGASRMLDSGVKAVDEGIQQNIYTEARADTDKVRTLFGADAYSTDQTMPAEVAAGKDHIQKLYDGYQNGSLRESYYYGQLETIVKGLRSKYPGYDQQIDNVIQNITGVTPANAVVSAIRSEAAQAAAKADAAANRWQSFVDTNAGYLEEKLPGYMDNQNKYTQAQARSAVAEAKAQHLEAEAAHDAYTTKTEQNASTDQDALRAAKVYATNADQTVASGAIASAGGFQEVYNKLISTKGNLDPAEVQGFNQNVAQAITNQTLKMNQILDTPDRNGNTLGSRLSDPQRKEVLDAATASLRAISEGINNKDYGVVGINAAAAVIRGDSEKRRILDEVPMAATVAATNSLYGPQIASQILLDPAINAPYQVFLHGTGMHMVAQGVPLNDVTSYFKAAPGEGTEAKTYKATVDQAVSAINDPKTDPKLVANNIQSLFGQPDTKFLDNFDLPSQKVMFSKLVNPATTAAVAKAAERNPQLWTNYATWASTNFKSIFKQVGADVQGAISNAQNVTVSYDGKTGKFSVKDNKSIFDATDPYDLMSRLGGKITQQPFEDLATARAFRAVNDINNMMDSFKPILDKDKADTPETMLRLLSTIGVDPSAPKNGPWFDSLRFAIANWINNETGAPPKKEAAPGEPVVHSEGTIMEDEKGNRVILRNNKWIPFSYIGGNGPAVKLGPGGFH